MYFDCITRYWILMPEVCQSTCRINILGDQHMCPCPWIHPLRKCSACLSRLWFIMLSASGSDHDISQSCYWVHCNHLAISSSYTTTMVRKQIPLELYRKTFCVSITVSGLIIVSYRPAWLIHIALEKKAWQSVCHAVASFHDRYTVDEIANSEYSMSCSPMTDEMT